MTISERDPSAKPENAELLAAVRGRIAFARRTADERAPEAAVPLSKEPMVSYDVTIRDARPIVDQLSLDREGFTLLRREIPRASDWALDAFRARYFAAMAPFIKDYLKASRVVAQGDGRVLRSSGGPPPSAHSDQESGGAVRDHAVDVARVDYSRIAGPMIAAREDQLQGNPIQPYSRLMIIQTWHALSPPPQDFSLALCDGTSVLDTDLLESLREGFDVAHKTWLLQYSPYQRWYYFPEMTDGEFILLKGYDSDENRNPRAAYSTFDNRPSYPHAHRSESVEARFFVYYD